ncbi:MAG: zinc-binding dehydrogenase, partial [Bacteroidaceae bacterium]
TATFPLIPGHEFVGELVEIKGAGEAFFKVGETVVAQEVISCGYCSACAKGESNACQHLKIIGIHTDGGFAEYVKVPASKLVKVPDGMDLDLAAMIEPLAVAVHDVRTSGLKAGETVLVVGGGPIGMLVAITAKATGAKKIVISEVNPFRSEFARKLGFDTVNPMDADFDKQLKALAGEEGFDVCFEVAGVRSAITTCVDYAKNTGTIMIIAITREPYPVDTGKIFAKELTLKGVRIHNFYNFKGAVDLLGDKQVAEEVRSLISKQFSIDDIVEAFEYAEHGKDSFKVVVNVG